MRLSQFCLRFLPALWLSAACAMSATAQTPVASADPCTIAPGAAFEVVSVHQMDELTRGTSIGMGPDQFTAKGATVLQLVLSAYDLRPFQVGTSLPDWARTARYQIDAKIEPPEPAFKTMNDADRVAAQHRMQLRLRTMLADRFALKCHTEMKEQPVYELVVAKGGIKMTTTQPDAPKRGSFSSSGSGLKMHAVGTGLTTGRIAALASNEVGRMIVDKTGLTGIYDFQADWVHDSASASPENTPDGPSFFTALEEQLGLKLVPAKAPVPLLVVDHVERPTDN